jgi:exonuclease III
MHMHQPRRKVIIQNSFYEELQQVSEHFPQYHMKILVGDFNAKLRREDIFNLTISNDSLHQDSNDNGVGLVHFATLKNLGFFLTVL